MNYDPRRSAPRKPSAHVKPKREHSPLSDKPGFQPRAAAVKILSAVIDQKTSLDGMLDDDHGNPAYRALSPADRALVKAIMNSCLRHLTWIDAIFDGFLDKPLPDGARNLRHILSVAAAQILFLDVPDHSAVDIAVEQARLDPRSSRFANLVNALLRRLGREKDDNLLFFVSRDVPVFPAWFHARLSEVYGNETADAIGKACRSPAPVDVTVKNDPAGWAVKLGGSVLPTGTVRLDAFDGSVTALPGFDEGAWWVQDAAASIPARLMGDLRGKRVADLCAAPGGKTAQLILKGGNVTAVEQSANRMKRLKGNLARLGYEAEFQQAKLEDLKPAELFDAVLLDAPCSSTGTIRRHPDVYWTKDMADVEKLASVQARLLRSAFGLVKPGGTLVFSNCSLDPLEGEELVAAFLAEVPDAERVPIRREDWPGLEEAIDDAGDFRTTPVMLGGMDGFFASVLRRKSH
ncbi:RsmB/NOP family class I SAM-dependent RNA methyltransferase [Rhizobium sp. TH2]|uniref:RsmB/NOP family class I SAM-dependent RNA methyltransferase n=1 Tax=Rhizobium sp. TH2 TaxID=2775403 RepID=UPI0021582B60|nr:RsmB/NOP family class I SAM-dependent RNA methyltransferase [Rhizobium sp. TH2]